MLTNARGPKKSPCTNKKTYERGDAQDKAE